MSYAERDEALERLLMAGHSIAKIARGFRLSAGHVRYCIHTVQRKRRNRDAKTFRRTNPTYLALESLKFAVATEIAEETEWQIKNAKRKLSEKSKFERGYIARTGYLPTGEDWAKFEQWYDGIWSGLERKPA